MDTFVHFGRSGPHAHLLVLDGAEMKLRKATNAIVTTIAGLNFALIVKAIVDGWRKDRR